MERAFEPYFLHLDRRETNPVDRGGFKREGGRLGLRRGLKCPQNLRGREKVRRAQEEGGNSLEKEEKGELNCCSFLRFLEPEGRVSL